MTTAHRDLALVDPWLRSLERSRHRRAITPAIRRSVARRRRTSVALSTLMVAGPTGSLLAAAGFGIGGGRVDVAQASPANRAIDDGATPAGMAFKLGSHGDAVAEIQRQLGVAADGFFGPVTHAAVLDFQSRNGLDVDGVVGPATWTALFGLEQAAAAAGAHQGDVAVIVRERAAAPSGASAGYDSTAGGGQADDEGSSGAGRETLAVGGDLPDTAGGSDDAPATKPVSSPPAAGNGACGPLRLASPVKGLVTSGFGPRWGRNHDGLDIAAPTGTPIRAAECGIVSFAGVQSGYGNMVCVKHSSRFETCYAHMTNYAVAQGQRVSRGQVIGYVGCTGSCTGPHLHFETRVDGAARDPRPYLGGGSVPGAPTVKAATTSKARAATAAAIAKDVERARIAKTTIATAGGTPAVSGGTPAVSGGTAGGWSSVESQPATGAPAMPTAPAAAPAPTGAPITTPTSDPSSATPPASVQAPATAAPTAPATSPAPTPTPTYEAPQPTYSAPSAPEATHSPTPATAPGAPATPAPETDYEPAAATTPPPAPSPSPSPAAETTVPAPPAPAEPASPQPATPAPEPSTPAPDPATQPVTEAPAPSAPAPTP